MLSTDIPGWNQADQPRPVLALFCTLAWVGLHGTVRFDGKFRAMILSGLARNLLFL